MSTAISPTAYNYKVVRQFAIMTVVWGILGMGLGVFIASQLVWPQLNFDLPWTTFGRLRPLHTNLVIFAFGGCALFATSYYVVQRTCQTRLISDGLAAFTFWGWQAVIVGAIISLPLGYTTTKEYAELEWPIAILLAIVWVTYGLVFFGTIVKRKTKHIYVGNWFYGAFIVVTAMLHIVNHASLPVNLFKSYSAYSGATDAMIQWWYGHNAVGFFLTTGFLGMMYYFVPKQAERPIYSYRLSIVHFWALITLYIWAGPHHLHYTALPDWAQSLGMAMSIILLAPSWGGMINGMMTLSGAWHKLRTDPILRFLVACDQRRRHPDLLLRRSAASQPPGLYRTCPGRCVLCQRHAVDGLQRLAHRACQRPCRSRSRRQDRRCGSSLMKHEVVEKNIGLLAFFMVIAVSIGGLTQIVPLFFQDVTNKPVEGMKPRTALELEGRDVYIANGCVGCHSQMIRPFRAETERYGHYSVAGESVWDHPFLWGSKRTGPDLARVGGRYSDDWQRAHLYNPRNVVPESKMPAYPFLVENKLDGKDTAKKMEVLRTLGVPYTDEDIAGAAAAVKGKTEMDALVAYLQGLGTIIKSKR